MKLTLPDSLPDDVVRELEGMSERDFALFEWCIRWKSQARRKQLPPPEFESGEKAIWGLRSGRGFGKLVALDTKIPTPSGWSTIGDVQVGDRVFDQAGHPCNVVAVYEDPFPDSVRLWFSDGTYIDCCMDHQWVTWTHNDRKQAQRKGFTYTGDWPSWSHGHRGPKIRTTQSIIDSFYIGVREDTNHSIPLAFPLELPETMLPVDPYLLGYWVGNGCTNNGVLWCHLDDMPEVIKCVGRPLVSVRQSTKTVGGRRNFAVALTFEDVHRDLRRAGFLNNKHIPAEYLRASTPQRLALLQGLMDSDGSCGTNSQAEFSTVRRELATQVVELMRTLGQKPVLLEGVAKCSGKVTGPKYRVTFRPTIPCFRSQRKLSRISFGGAQWNRNLHRMITKWESIPSTPMKCLTVDSPHNMFLVGEGMIPTHNTLTGANWIGQRAAMHDGYYGVVAPTYDDVVHTCFNGSSGLLTVTPEILIDKVTQSPPLLKLWNGSQIRGFAADSPERLRGPQHHSGWCLTGDTLVSMADGSRKPIASVVEGDLVVTRIGPRRVFASRKTMENVEVYKIKTGHGHTLRGTMNHRVYVEQRGYVPICQLNLGDLTNVLIHSEGKYIEPKATAGTTKTQKESAPGLKIKEHARPMGNYSIVTSPVAAVEKCQSLHDVYDISVEGAREFFANGVLVHNCDEVASWKYPQMAWDNFMFGLRLGTNPQLVWTSTPKPTPFIRKLQLEPRSIVVTGSTYENRANLAPTFYDNIAKYEGTQVGRQELHGDVLDPEEGGLVKRSAWRMWPKDKLLPHFEFIIMSVDSAFTEKDHDKKTQKNDPTACSVWGLFTYDRVPNVVLIDAWEEYLGFPDLVDRVRKESTFRYGSSINEPIFSEPLHGEKRPRRPETGRKPDLILVEAKASGQSLLQQLAREGVFADSYNPGKLDKLSRLHAVSPLWAHGRVWAVESNHAPDNFKAWAEPLISQVCSFTGEGSLAHDDLLDTTTQALRLFMDRHIGALVHKPSVEQIEVERALRDMGRLKRNPYD